MTIRGMLVAVTAALLGSTVAHADPFSISYGTPGQQSANAIVISNANTLGVENFETRSSGPFTTDFGTGGVITGSYSGSPVINGPDQYGSAGGVGNQIDVIGNSYTLTLSTDGSIPGVNYFGFWLSALDGGNQLSFYRGGVGGTLVGQYSPADLIAALGACPNAYCGNPNAAFLGDDSNEPFAFVNFVDLGGYFDTLVFSEDPNVGNYESDNHTVAYCSDPRSCVTGTVVGSPEPLTLSLFGAGLAGLGIARRRRRKAA